MNNRKLQTLRRLVAFLFFVGSSMALSFAQPTNDLFANRTFITGTNIVVTGSSIGASHELGEPNHAGISGGASVWWAWTAPLDGAVAISTSGSSFDTLLGIYTGTSVTALTPVDSNDDADYYSSVYTSKVIFDAAANQAYAIAVDGWPGDSGSITLALQCAPQASAWALTDVHGGTNYSSNYAGKVVVLNFWSTTSPASQEEMTDLVALQARYGSLGLSVVGAHQNGQTKQTVLSFLVSFVPTVNYPVVMATEAMQDAYGGLAVLPTTFIVDRQSAIREKFVGRPDAGTLERQILPLLGNVPELSFQRSGSYVALRWPTNKLPFVLQYTTNVWSASWTNWGPAIVVNGSNTVFVPVNGSQRFFRLQLAN